MVDTKPLVSAALVRYATQAGYRIVAKTVDSLLSLEHKSEHYDPWKFLVIDTKLDLVRKSTNRYWSNA